MSDVTNQQFFTEFGIETYLVGLIGVSITLLVIAYITRFIGSLG